MSDLEGRLDAVGDSMCEVVQRLDALTERVCLLRGVLRDEEES